MKGAFICICRIVLVQRYVIFVGWRNEYLMSNRDIVGGVIG